MPEKNLTEIKESIERECEKVCPTLPMLDRRHLEEIMFRGKAWGVFDPAAKIYGVSQISTAEANGQIFQTNRRFLDLMEISTRKALIALGWTPPENEEMPHA